jgi:hypothetical protein
MYHLDAKPVRQARKKCNDGFRRFLHLTNLGGINYTDIGRRDNQ